MSRYPAFLLFLAIVPWICCAADPIDYPAEYDAAPTTKPPLTTTTAETTTTTKDATTTAAPTTTTTTKDTTTTAAPTTTPTTKDTTTTAAPTTTTKAPPTTTTTAAPPTTTTTTKAPPTTTTTSPTNTTSTAPIPTTTTPAPPLPDPTDHLYKVLDKDNNTCLMVNFGLRVGFHGDKYEEMNFEYSNKTTEVAGSCDEDNSTLVIQDDTLTLSLTFHNDSKKFSLLAVNATGKLNSGVTFSEINSTMTLWQASLGSSYMCNKEQTYNITRNFTIFTFKLQVQPFGVKKDSFSMAQECSMDDTSILIPIVVGAALAGLILIVVIAYVIGRRKTYVGYQTL